MRIKLIANAPDRDTVEALQAEVSTLRTQGYEVRPSMTFEGGDARRFAEEAAVDGMELVIAAGGDGTINEVVNGFDDFLEVFAAGSPDIPPPTLPRLGLVPLGTGNDFATSLGVPNEIPSAVHVAVHGEPLEVDIGRVNERDFLNVSTGGVGAEATEETPSEIKNVIGPLAYLITGVRKFVTLESSQARFTADEVIYDGPFMIFAVGNSKLTGGGNQLTPKADLTDGLLDLCIVKEMPRMDLLKLPARPSRGAAPGSSGGPLSPGTPSAGGIGTGAECECRRRAAAEPLLRLRPPSAQAHGLSPGAPVYPARVTPERTKKAARSAAFFVSEQSGVTARERPR